MRAVLLEVGRPLLCALSPEAAGGQRQAGEALSSVASLLGMSRGEVGRLLQGQPHAAAKHGEGGQPGETQEEEPLPWEIQQLQVCL